MLENIFHGTQPVFWVGCVEERDDSKAKDKLKLGRVRVRVLGFHSPELKEDNEKGEGIPVDQLPWAYPINPITNAANSGVGQSPTGIVEGTWVVGFAMDGAAMQDLYIMGTLMGVPEKAAKANATFGFQDPDGDFPRKEYVGEEDTNRLARNDSDHPHAMLKVKKDKRVKNIKTASGKLGKPGEKWDEPESEYDAKYPHNHVHESEAGHIHEVDDTPGAARLHQYHMSGTFTEIGNDGARVNKIVGQDYEIVEKNKHVYIEGNLNITVGKEARILVEGDAFIEVEGDASIQSEKSMLVQAKDQLVMKGKDIMVAADNSITVLAKGPLTATGANTNPSDTATGII